MCKAQILGGTERSTEALGLWTSSLKMLNLRGLESANVAKAKIAKITALKISNPSRVFAVVAKAGSMGATDRSTKSQRLWTSSLRMWKFKRLETWNFQNFATRIFLVALAKGKPQETGKTASFVPPAFPPRPRRVKIEPRARMRCPE